MLKIVPEGEKSFQESRRVWSLAFMGDLPYATIYAEWPLLPKEPYEVSIAIVLGEWGAGASPSDRFWIFVVYRSASESGFMIVDPPSRVFCFREQQETPNNPLHRPNRLPRNHKDPRQTPRRRHFEDRLWRLYAANT